MARRAPRLIIDIHDERVDIFLENQKVTEVWIDTNNHAHFTPLQKVEVIEHSPIGPSERRPISVQTLVTKRDVVGLPRTHADRGAEQDTAYHPSPPERVRPDEAPPDSVDQHTAGNILDRVLKSHVMHPNMTSKISGEETKRIAAELDVLPMAVAGVKAALTRGVYGDKDELIERMRRRAIVESRRATEVGRDAPPPQT